MPLKPLIAGNWKMNGDAAALPEIAAISEIAATSRPEADILICPPATLVFRAAQTAADRIVIGGQDCAPESSGAFTGDISAEMLRDAGAMAVIVGHSERRQLHGETDAIVCAKAKAAWRAGLLAIICVGETEGERAVAEHNAVCKAQLAASVPEGAHANNTAIAYEPVWAIGTGKTPTIEDIAAMHRHIRTCLSARFVTEGRDIRILYGGSVKPANAREILATAEVGGALVGGASLKAYDFHAILSAVEKP
ncbi:MAG TPA: triose-phosphate isomerase [Rhizomicrobium sp.]|jgi:triosephosphate isomerase|nr:triose-phosphate isomerase [Rhizomicrobium sp.]